jgi:hypothetical protein
MSIELYFSQHFGVSRELLEEHGAFDISLACDVPLLVNPFLPFNSERPEYLHDGIIRYLVFLRDRAAPNLNPGLIKSWCMFQEISQNWLGFTVLGNAGCGCGLGMVLVCGGKVFEDLSRKWDPRLKSSPKHHLRSV